MRRIVVWLSLALTLAMSASLPLAPRSRAQLLDGVTSSLNQTLNQTLSPGRKVSAEIIRKVNNGQSAERVRVIVHPRGDWSGDLNTALLLNGASDVRQFQNFDFRAVNLPAGAAAALAQRTDVSYVSINKELRTLGHVSQTTGADAVRTTAGTTTSGLDGTGIGIAVIDSGIDTTHKAFLDKSNGMRVVASVDFTGEGRTDDPYGHGTHVASIAAGNGRISNAAYTGVAPNANIINLRVLNSQGSGTTTYLLRALDWVLSNRALYNIRVVNLSLGMPAVESYRDDPACQAVRRVVDAGIVVVAAAGNNGKDSAGNKVYGHIHSPGNDPSALTVGAANSFGTDARGDDMVTTYSSRGPTRSYRTDAYGVRHYDNLIKPDLVAPGNKIVDAAAANNQLLAQHPELDAGVSPVDNRRQMYLNGTSMATPAVAGAAALLLQANPTLTPNLVKALLTYTAQPLAGFNFFEQGAGELNIEGAVRLAKLVRTDLSSSTPLGDPLLTGAPPAPQTTIAGHTFNWSRGLILNYNYVTGLELITRYQKIYGLGVITGDAVITGDGVITGDRSMITDGVITGDQIMTSAGVITGDGPVFLASANLLLEEGTHLHDGDLTSDGVITGDRVITGDGVITGDLFLQAQSAALEGDATEAMDAAVDDGVDCLDY